MEFNIDYNFEKVTDVTLCPNKDESADKLHQYSQMLRVDNPALGFSKDAKSGLFNDLCDGEYRDALYRIKAISKVFFNDKLNENVFKLNASMMKYILQNDRPLIRYADKMKTEPIKDEERLDAKTRHFINRNLGISSPADFGFSVSEIIDMYPTDVSLRNRIYNSILDSRDLVWCDDVPDYLEIECDYCRYRMPHDNLTVVIYTNVERVVLTFHNPYGQKKRNCIDYGTVHDSPQNEIDDVEEYLKNHVCITFWEDENMAEYPDSPILWYHFWQGEFEEYFEYMGKLKFVKDLEWHNSVKYYEMEVIDE